MPGIPLWAWIFPEPGPCSSTELTAADGNGALSTLSLGPPPFPDSYPLCLGEWKGESQNSIFVFPIPLPHSYARNLSPRPHPASLPQKPTTLTWAPKRRDQRPEVTSPQCFLAWSRSHRPEDKTRQGYCLGSLRMSILREADVCITEGGDVCYASQNSLPFLASPKGGAAPQGLATQMGYGGSWKYWWNR